jgi:hypothetical protein
MSASDPFNLIDDLTVTACAQTADATPLVVMPLELEVVMDETIQLLCEKLAEAERARDLAQGAMRAQDENYRAQLAALGLTERFPSHTHLADDMGEALLRAEKRLMLLENAARRVANQYGNTSWNIGAIRALIYIVNNPNAQELVQ